MSLRVLLRSFLPGWAYDLGRRLYRYWIWWIVPVVMRSDSVEVLSTTGNEGEETLVIMPCHNQWKYTKQAIESFLIMSSGKHMVHLVVVDDCSTDDTARELPLLCQTLAHHTLLRYRRNVGCTQAWNDGISYALEHFEPRFVYVINNDIILPCSCFDRLNRHLEMSPGLVSPITNSSGHQPLQDYREYHPELKVSATQTSVDAIAACLPECSLIRVAYANGFFFGLDTETLRNMVWARFGRHRYFFHPRNRNVGNEDEFQQRMQLKGYPRYICTDCFIFHFGNVTLNRQFP